MNWMQRTTATLGVIGIGLWALGCGGGAATSVASLTQPKGAVEARSQTTEAFKPAAGEVPLQVGGAVRTGEDGRCLVKYLAGCEVTLSPETYYEIKEQATLGRQESGSARYQIPTQQKPVGVETPHGFTAVLGTTFRLDVTATQTVVVLKEGKIRFTSRASETVDLTPGQQLTVSAGQPLAKPAELDPISLETLFNPDTKLPGINQR